jgi:hypothetical protein
MPTSTLDSQLSHERWTILRAIHDYNAKCEERFERQLLIEGATERDLVYMNSNRPPPRPPQPSQPSQPPRPPQPRRPRNVIEQAIESAMRRLNVRRAQFSTLNLLPYPAETSAIHQSGPPSRTRLLLNMLPTNEESTESESALNTRRHRSVETSADVYRAIIAGMPPRRQRSYSTESRLFRAMPSPSPVSPPASNPHRIDINERTIYQVPPPSPHNTEQARLVHRPTR